MREVMSLSKGWYVSPEVDFVECEGFHCLDEGKESRDKKKD